MVAAVFADGIGKIMAGAALMVLGWKWIEEVVIKVVLVGVVEVRFMVFSQNPSLLGKQFEQHFPAFTQTQPLISLFYCICYTPFSNIWIMWQRVTTIKSTSITNHFEIVNKIEVIWNEFSCYRWNKKIKKVSNMVLNSWNGKWNKWVVI